MPDQLGADTSAREKTAERENANDLDHEIDTGVDLFAPNSTGSDGAEGAHLSAGADDHGLTDGDQLTRDKVGDADGPIADSDEGPGPVEGTNSSVTADGPGLMARLGIRTRGQLRARKVQRIVRRVDPWSVLKVSLLFYFCVWVMVMVALILIWGTAMSSGTVESLESFIAEFLAFEEFKFNGDQLFQIFALGGLIGVFVATAATAVLAVLFNLIADLTGGIRFTVVEEESARRIINPR